MTKPMDFRQIRQAFLDYFKGRGHAIVESSSLIPRDDPTLLFTNAGMVQFKRMFLGEEKRGYTRAATCQKCVRAGGKHNDLDNVGYTARHHTFFEMLGNFSFGDYFKEEAIVWAWELLTQVYGLPEERLYVSVFKDDDEARRIWAEKVGVPAEKIVPLGEKDNFWAMGDTGPCGPCSEIYIDQGPEIGCGRPDCHPGCDCDRFLEIWNLVFTQFDRSPDGSLTPLPRPNIDTGMGLERLAAVIQGASSNYGSDIFKDILDCIGEFSGRRYGEDARQDVAFRVIADHSRAVTFLINDGVMPSNEGRGYVLRRIIRRAVRFGQVLGMQDVFLNRVCSRVIAVMAPDYPDLIRSQAFIEGVVTNEEKRFADTLHYGMRVLEEEIERLRAGGARVVPGDVLFKLYDTYGLSADIVEDVVRDEGFALDMEGYGEAMSRQRTQSQESWKGSGEEAIPEGYRAVLSRGVATPFVGYTDLASEAEVAAVLVDGREQDAVSSGVEAELILSRTPFYGQAGGQMGDRGWIESDGARFLVKDTRKYGQDLIVHQGVLESGRIGVGAKVKAVVDETLRRATAANHSATHLLHAALREVLGDHVKQAGSMVSAERLRFDFSHFTQVSADKLLDVERRVNARIRENHPLETEVMTREEAAHTGAMAIFEERYGERVRVVSVGEDVSKELCGGTHTARTGDIGLFRIVSEAGVAANVRRIEALTGEAALLHDEAESETIRRSSALLKTTPDALLERVERLVREHREKDREIEALKARLLTRRSDEWLQDVRRIGDVSVLAQKLDADGPKALREAADRIRDKLGSGVILLGAVHEQKVMLICVVTADLQDRFKAGEIVRRLSPIVGGKGGGRPDMAQGGGTRPDKLAETIEAFYDLMSGHP
ncbi:alanyl-tRNA synthetase [uncultured Desulfatiglans sp.]|nr:alanyl-tRNA synthetase [uncultured Desulfatiglans sp.]